MKKNYITPTINVVKIQQSIMQSSSIPVDTNTGTTTQGSRYNAIDFSEDEDDYAGNW